MPKPTGRPAAFTLIEILLAMAIMAVICGTIYQFTGTTVQVADVATRTDARAESLGGLRRLLAAQFAALPTSEPQALTGAANDGEHGRQDILQMLCPAGGALLTPDARGLYQVAFETRELPAGSGHHALVLNREPWAASQDEENSRTSARTRPDGWVRLLDGVRSLEFDYFDPRLNTWVDKWNDPTMAPGLVRVRLALENGGAPYEFVEKVPGGGVPRLPANLAAAALTLPNGGAIGSGVPAGNGNLPAGVAPIIAKGGGAGRPSAGPPTAPPPGPPPPRRPAGRPPPAHPGGSTPPSRCWRPTPGPDSDMPRAASSPLPPRLRDRGIALILVLCSLLVLSFVVIGLARRVDQSVFLAARESHALDARALAFTGLQYALHPQTTVRTPALRHQNDRGHGYEARIVGEGGKLQLNWALAGEDLARVDLLKEYLRMKGLKAEECDVFVDCLLDFTTPGNIHHLNGSQTAIDGAPVPGKPFSDLSEVRRVVGNEPLTRQEGWENWFTLYSQGPIDLKWADEDLIGALPGVGRDRARAFVQRRQGPDKLDGTPDDYPINSVADAAVLLGLNQNTLAQLQALLNVNDPTVRVISRGQALDTSRTIEVVARKTGAQPQILQWKEF